MSPNRLDDLDVAPLSESFEVTRTYNADQFPNKVNLGQGVYRDDNAQPWVLPSVQAAEETLHNEHGNHEYLPISGHDQFNKRARALLFGSEIHDSYNICTVQTVAGTGANHLAALFCAQILHSKNVFISDPTWDNHHAIWKTAAPGTTQKLYPCHNISTCTFDFKRMIAELENSAVENDVVVLHACAHNPTGCDPTHDQWDKIADVVGRKRLFVVFDSAYQGFASGDPDADAWAIRHFYSKLFGSNSGIENPPLGMLVCQSFSKNFGLYGERIGALHLVTPPGVSPSGAYTQLIALIRSIVSCPSLFGARVVNTILSDAELYAQWKEDVVTMSSRIRDIRLALRLELEKINTEGDWSHITRQIGMFSYTGLSEAQVQRLREVHHVYMLKNGRMSLSGLNAKNVGYVACAIKEVVEQEL
ncbi:hypothetical protein N7466_002773 [Penicillium verhagenii]|uniref:uncharacterized protein n=1 Tax=Penicillium verhagenii TaxID=1562060 RepID=UPI0025457BE9|nr:uncharacterized protein N7466_002773 [Penicillium verhagenii]KAJ5939639.1 hypothetical protein N7466_002773 [Penicillium verhagenii]